MYIYISRSLLLDITNKHFGRADLAASFEKRATKKKVLSGISNIDVLKASRTQLLSDSLVEEEKDIAGCVF